MIGNVQTAESALRTVRDKPDKSEDQIAKVKGDQKADARNRAEISVQMTVRLHIVSTY
jgi:hypothetical protein